MADKLFKVESFCTLPDEERAHRRDEETWYEWWMRAGKWLNHTKRRTRIYSKRGYASQFITTITKRPNWGYVLYEGDVEWQEVDRAE